HAFDEAFRSHIGPISIYVLQASRAAVRLPNYGPPLGDVDKAWPQGILAFVIDQNVERAAFVFKWIRHIGLLRNRMPCVVRHTSSSVVSTRPIASAGPGSIIVSWVQSIR